MLEGYAFADAAPAAGRDAGILGALSFAARPWLVLDAGCDVGLTASRAVTIFVGATVIPVDLWETAHERRVHPHRP
jgi:hypothetical protein